MKSISDSVKQEERRTTEMCFIGQCYQGAEVDWRDDAKTVLTGKRSQRTCAINGEELSSHFRELFCGGNTGAKGAPAGAFRERQDGYERNRGKGLPFFS